MHGMNEYHVFYMIDKGDGAYVDNGGRTCRQLRLAKQFRTEEKAKAFMPMCYLLPGTNKKNWEIRKLKVTMRLV